MFGKIKNIILIILLIFLIGFISIVLTKELPVFSPEDGDDVVGGDAISDVLDRLFPWRRPAGCTFPIPDRIVCAKFVSPPMAQCQLLKSVCTFCGGDGSYDSSGGGVCISIHKSMIDKVLEIKGKTKCDECYPDLFQGLLECCDLPDV